MLQGPGRPALRGQEGIPCAQLGWPRYRQREASSTGSWCRQDPSQAWWPGASLHSRCLKTRAVCPLLLFITGAEPRPAGGCREFSSEGQLEAKHVQNHTGTRARRAREGAWAHLRACKVFGVCRTGAFGASRTSGNTFGRRSEVSARFDLPAGFFAKCKLRTRRCISKLLESAAHVGGGCRAALGVAEGRICMWLITHNRCQETGGGAGKAE